MKLSTKKTYHVKKYLLKLVVWSASALSVIWIGTIFEPLFLIFNTFIFRTSGDLLVTLLLGLVTFLNFKISLGSLFLFIIFLYVIYYVINKISLERRMLIIVDAKYGDGGVFADITSKLNELVLDNKLNVLVSNGLAGYDPTPGIVKTLKLKYSYGKKEFEKKYKENGEVKIP